jgi:FAD/FMN-containing dehydrogenase
MTRTPFAIKCSGHSANPGFSSTSGVQISMSRFRDIVLNEEQGTVEFGAGLAWSDLYSYLVPKGLNVVGGRLDVVGVAGFILGGGEHFPACCACTTIAHRYIHVLQDILGRPISMGSR